MKTIKLCKDQDCPLCGYPETLLVCELLEDDNIGKALRFECSSRKCKWEEPIDKKGS